MILIVILKALNKKIRFVFMIPCIPLDCNRLLNVFLNKKIVHIQFFNY